MMNWNLLGRDKRIFECNSYITGLRLCRRFIHKSSEKGRKSRDRTVELIRLYRKELRDLALKGAEPTDENNSRST